MKRLLLILVFLSVAVATSAQYAPNSLRNVRSSAAISVRGDRVYLDGALLTSDQAAVLFSDINGIDRSGDYLKYRKGYRAGLGLSIAGASLVTAGSVVGVGSMFSALFLGIPLALAGEHGPMNRAQIALLASEVSLVAGLACTIAGLPTLFVYKNRIQYMALQYDAATRGNQPYISFGPQPSGVGFALNF